MKNIFSSVKKIENNKNKNNVSVKLYVFNYFGAFVFPTFVSNEVQTLLNDPRTDPNAEDASGKNLFMISAESKKQFTFTTHIKILER